MFPIARPALTLACFGVFGVTVTAQNTAPQPAVPTAPPGSEDAERRVPRVPGEVESFSPRADADRRPIRPGLTSGEDWATLLNEGEVEAGPMVLPERSFLNGLRGEVLAGPHETRIFVYANEAEPKGDRHTGAMLLLPCVVLERFDEFTFKRHERVPALVSGQVFRYEGKNYLLPSALSAAMNRPGETLSDPVIDDIETEAGSAADPQEDPQQGPQQDAVRQGEVDSLIESLERRPVYSRRRARGGSGQTTTTAPSAPEAGSSGGGSAEPDSGDAGRDGTGPAMVDGSYISARRGRMIRSIDGSWIFVSDNEAGDGLRLTLLPCRMLERLERIVFREGDSAAVTLSGRVHKFWGDQYILPTLFERERRDGVEPLQ